MLRMGQVLSNGPVRKHHNFLTLLGYVEQGSAEQSLLNLTNKVQNYYTEKACGFLSYDL